MWLLVYLNYIDKFNLIILNSISVKSHNFAASSYTISKTLYFEIETQFTYWYSFMDFVVWERIYIYIVESR